jgi:hypothetical protein
MKKRNGHVRNKKLSLDGEGEEETEKGKRKEYKSMHGNAMQTK